LGALLKSRAKNRAEDVFGKASDTASFLRHTHDTEEPDA